MPIYIKSKFLKVKRGTSGLGIFTRQKIFKGNFIIKYIGNIISEKEIGKNNNKYLFQINNKLVLDGSTRRNLARYINHSCRPNCEVKIKDKKILIYTAKEILPGQELTYDYGKEYFEIFIKPSGCKCAFCQKRKRL